MENLTQKAQLIAKILVGMGIKFQIGGSFGLYKRGLIYRKPQDLDIFTYPGKFPEIVKNLGIEGKSISENYDSNDGAYKASYKIMGVKVCFFLMDIHDRKMDMIDGLPISKPSYAINAKKEYVLKLIQRMYFQNGTAQKHFNDLEAISKTLSLKEPRI